MANFYYVKSGGTATGDAGRVATTRSTGSFATKGAAAYYDNIEDAKNATTTPILGDFLMCSDLHAFTGTANRIINFVNSGVTIISVDDANCDQYKPGATESIDNGGSTLDNIIQLPTQNSEIYILGMTLEAEKDVGLYPFLDGYFYVQDCIFNQLDTAVGSVFIGGTGVVVVLKDCEMNFVNIASNIELDGNGIVLIDNLKRGVSPGTTLTALIHITGVGGGAAIIKNTDLSRLISSGGDILYNLTSVDDRANIQVSNCKLPTSYGLIEGSQGITNYKVVLESCGITDSYHHFEREERDVLVIQDLVTYLGATYDGATGFSTKITTPSKIEAYNPYRYRLGTIPDQDLSTAQTVKVECTSDSGLTDNDIWIEVIRQDGTDQALRIIETTQPADMLSAGNALTISTKTWVSGDTANYVIAKDIPALAAVTNSNVEVWVCMGKPNISANFDLPSIQDTV